MLSLEGWSHFARHYFGNLGWCLFLSLLRCFSSRGSLHTPYVFRCGCRKSGGFPHSEIFGSKLVCQLPEAYRRLQRPSSPVIAKASITCTYSLDPITSTITSTCYRFNFYFWHVCRNPNLIKLICITDDSITTHITCCLMHSQRCIKRIAYSNC